MNFLAPYKALALAGLLAAMTIGLVALLWHHERIGYDRAVAEYTVKALVAEQVSRSKERSLQEQLKKAQDDFTKRQAVLQKDAATATAASNSLRDTLTSLSGNLSTITESARNERTAALADVLGRCSDKYQAMAATADRLNSDRQLILEAWPK